MKRHTAVKLVTVPALIASIAFSMSACGEPSSTTNDQNATNTQLQKYQANQPIPQADWSQYRQTVIDVENAQIHGMATTTFMYNMGSNKPIASCPSIGFPVPTTAQLTNPDQALYPGSSGSAVIAQAEANGVYTGASTGTYVVCVNNKGTKYIQYWEGDVNTVGGPAHWDNTSAQIVLDGEPTVKVTTK